MITAIEANCRSTEANTKLEQVYRSNLEVLMENAIREGKYEFFYEGIMYSELYEELLEKGFKINKVRRFNPDRIIWSISWEDSVVEEEEVL